MKYAVIFEETVKHQHQVILDCEDEEALEDALYGADHGMYFDYILSKLLNNGAKIVDIERDYYVDCDECEYYDAYEYHDEDEEVEG